MTIASEEEYRAALKALWAILDTEDYAKIGELADAINAYEEKKWPIPVPFADP